jgi:hypothetical protein
MVHPSKMLRSQALGLRENSVSFPANTSSYFRSHWRHRRARVTTPLPGMSLLVTLVTSFSMMAQDTFIERLRDRTVLFPMSVWGSPDGFNSSCVTCPKCGQLFNSVYLL